VSAYKGYLTYSNDHSLSWWRVLQCLLECLNDFAKWEINISRNIRCWIDLQITIFHGLCLAFEWDEYWITRQLMSWSTTYRSWNEMKIFKCNMEHGSFKYFANLKKTMTSKFTKTHILKKQTISQHHRSNNWIAFLEIHPFQEILSGTKILKICWDFKVENSVFGNVSLDIVTW
jgi:hypothetical protein